MRQIARERDKARLDLEKVERCCLQLGRELDEQYVALKHTQRKLKYERSFSWGRENGFPVGAHSVSIQFPFVNLPLVLPLCQ